jgi:hypothetical protein
MRREPDFFGDRELVLVHVARRLKEALALEEVFNAGGLDYAVVPATYTAGVVFRSERVGAFFYVAPQSEDCARNLILRGGFKLTRPV